MSSLDDYNIKYHYNKTMSLIKRLPHIIFCPDLGTVEAQWTKYSSRTKCATQGCFSRQFLETLVLKWVAGDDKLLGLCEFVHNWMCHVIQALGMCDQRLAEFRGHGEHCQWSEI